MNDSTTNPHHDKDTVKNALRGRYEAFYGQYTHLTTHGKELRGPCPLHGGKNPSFAVDADSGVWHCHSKCGKGGDVLEFLKEKEGLTFPQALDLVATFAGVRPEDSQCQTSRPQPRQKPAPVHDEQPVEPGPFLDERDERYAEEAHRRLMSKPAMLAWLLSHRGLTLSTIERFHVGVTEGDSFSEPRLTFLVRDTEGRLTNIRKYLPWWKEGKEPEDTRKDKTLPYAKGLRADLFPLSAIEGQTDVLLVEGETDALIANQFGFPAVTGTLGAGNWKPYNTDALRGKSVTILYDNDEAGRNGAQKRAKELHSAGIPVKVGRYPDGIKDMTELCLCFGEKNDVQAMIDTAQEYAPEAIEDNRDTEDTTELPPLTEWFTDLADIPPPPAHTPMIFGPYLMPGSIHWLTGQNGIGKSTLLYNIATALAEGTELLGIPCHPRNVLYFDMESGDTGRARKLERLYRGERRAKGKLMFLKSDVRLEKVRAILPKLCRLNMIDLVIFDTARRCFQVRDENDNAEFYRVIAPVLDDLKAFGVASLTLGHPSKGGDGSARGAGAQEDAGDINLTLTMHRGEKSDPNGVLCLAVTKHRLEGLGVSPLYLQRAGNDRFERVEPNAQPEGFSDDTPATSLTDGAKETVIAFLEAHDEPQRRKDILADAKENGHTERTVGRALETLERAGVIDKPKNGVYALSARTGQTETLDDAADIPHEQA